MARTKIKGQTMNYFKDNNNNVFAYDDEQIEQGYGKDLTPITFEEVQSINKIKEDSFKETIEYKINEAKAYLSSTDYKMTVDYFATLSQDVQDELIKLRAEARQFIRENEV